MDTAKKYALVTGGTSGIGYELAKRLARDGNNLVIAARSEADLERVADEFTQAFGVNVVTIPTDLFDPENAFSLYENIRSRGDIQVDILVNDAGQGQYGEFLDTDIRRELMIINLNISSLVVLTKLFLRDMVGRGHGRILNLSSIASKLPGPWQSVYHATKAFVQSFTEAVRSEVKGTGVTLTALLPGATATDFFNKANMTESKVVKGKELDDPAKVAEDGYKAMMAGDDMIVSGLKNKIKVASGNMMPDSMAADRMKKMQEPIGQEEESEE